MTLQCPLIQQVDTKLVCNVKCHVIVSPVEYQRSAWCVVRWLVARCTWQSCRAAPSHGGRMIPTCWEDVSYVLRCRPTCAVADSQRTSAECGTQVGLAYLHATRHMVNMTQAGRQCDMRVLYYVSTMKSYSRMMSSVTWPFHSHAGHSFKTVICTTRKPSYRKDARVMRPTYGCPKNFWESLSMPTDGLLFRSILWMCV